MATAGVLRLDDAIAKRMTRGPDERIENARNLLVR